MIDNNESNVKQEKQEILPLSKKFHRISGSRNNKSLPNMINRNTSSLSSPIPIISSTLLEENDIPIKPSLSLPVLPTNKEDDTIIPSSSRGDKKSRHKKIPLLQLSSLNISPPTSESPSSPSTPVSPMSRPSLSPLTPLTPSSDIFKEIRHSIQDSNGNINRFYKSPSDMIYSKHKNGILNLNKKEFNNVNFCFICDTIFDNLSIDEIMINNYLRSSIEITGINLLNGAVYRTIYYCKQCSVRVDNNSKLGEIDDFNSSLERVIKITSKANTYFI